MGKVSKCISHGILIVLWKVLLRCFCVVKHWGTCKYVCCCGSWSKLTWKQSGKTVPGRPSSHRTQVFLGSCPLLSCWEVLSQELLYFCGLNSTLQVVMLTREADGTYPSLPPTFLSCLSSQVTLVWPYPFPSPQTYSQLLHTFTAAFGRAGSHTGLLCLRVKSTKICIQAINQFLSVNTTNM